MLDLGRDILEEFAAHGCQLTYGVGFCIRNPAKQAEQCRDWKQEHPARVRQHRLRYSRSHGIGPKLCGEADPRSKPFVDQYGTRYGSITDGATRCGLTRGLVSWALRTGKPAAGRVFRYA